MPHDAHTTALSAEPRNVGTTSYPQKTPIDGFSPETVDGTSLKEVAQMLAQLDTASSFVKEGVLAYLKNRSHPAFLMPGWDKPLGPDTPVSEYAEDTVIEGQG